MILFIASEVMFFVGWFWAFFDFSLFPALRWRRSSGMLPVQGHRGDRSVRAAALNTLILLCSGTTVTWAHHALIHGDREGLNTGLWLTIAARHAVHQHPGL